MQAVVYDRWASKGRKWVTARAVPEPKADELLVRVHAAALNPVDYKLPAMVFAGKVVGLDVAGVVEKVGASVTGVSVGDRVFGNASGGALADLTLCKAREVTAIPSYLSMDEAAALPTAHLSAYQALTRNGFEVAGKRTLVIGASGGCGSAGVQLAKLMGASEVVGVCSGKNADFVKGLGPGADVIIDYTTTTPLKELGPDSCDFIYDTATASGAGESYRGQAVKMLKPGKGSLFVALNAGIGTWLKYFTGLMHSSQSMVLTKHRKADLDAICALMSPGESRPVVASTFNFSAEGVEAAFASLKSRRTKGKIIVQFPAAAAAADGNATATGETTSTETPATT